jgi:hypothetical protein
MSDQTEHWVEIVANCWDGDLFLEIGSVMQFDAVKAQMLLDSKRAIKAEAPVPVSAKPEPEPAPAPAPKSTAKPK